MSRKSLDPNLASILDSIRATVGGETPALVPDESQTETGNTEEPTGEPAARRSTKSSSDGIRAGSSKAEPRPAARTVEEFLADMIRPQVDAWLKANLPEMIQKMAAEEIARLTGRT